MATHKASAASQHHHHHHQSRRLSAVASPAAGAAAAGPVPEPPPSLFDLFYEEFLTRLMNEEGGAVADALPEEFMRRQTDIERVECVMGLGEFVRSFAIPGKAGVKSVERSARYREEGNRMFQADQATQSILFYNKALAYAPHPDYDSYQNLQQHQQQQQQQQQGSAAGAKKSPPSKYEALSFCYANRSAALRKLGQYDDCLRDVARAAKFGYPRENIYKLWERKAKCYQGMRKYEQAVKCFRQAIQALKESALSDNQKTIKSHEIQGWIKDLRAHLFSAGSIGSADLFVGEDAGVTTTAAVPPPPVPAEPLMGATGPIIIVPDPVPKARKASTMTLPPPEPTTPLPAKPERRSFRRKKTVKDKDGKPSPLPNLPNGGGGGGGSGSAGGGDSGGSGTESTTSLNKPPVSPSPLPPASPAAMAAAAAAAAAEHPQQLQKANSQMSISQISTTGVKPEIEVPELSYGQNPRMPSASSAVDVRFTPEKGRYFVALQDLSPGDVVLREEPYAAVLEAIFRVNHCAHCLKKTPTPIPCYQCATVQYCSETCRDLSWTEYHRIECGILAYLEPSRYLGKMPHLALRIITRTGMQNLIQHSMTSLLPTLKNGDQQQQHDPQVAAAAAPPTPALFDPHSYRSVHNLATNADKRPFEDLIKKTAIAIFMAKCLKFNGFFGDPAGDEAQAAAAASQTASSQLPATTAAGAAAKDTKRAEIFVSSLLLRHLQIASTNGLEMAECILKNNDVTKFDIIPVGGAIFPTISFFNHSCYPNALRLGYQNFQVVRVIRTVARGEEVNIDYGFDFYANSKEARNKRAQSQYFFSCRCAACAEDWPVYNAVSQRPRQMKVRPTPTLAEELERQAAAYTIGMDFLLRLDIGTAMPIFRDYLMVMNELVVHPDARYIDCEEAYKQCLWLENRGYKAAKASNPTSPTHPHAAQQHHPDVALRQTSTTSTVR